MKKIFLSTALLLSFVVKADDAVTSITPETMKPESSANCETVKPENIVAENIAPAIESVPSESTKSKEIETNKAPDFKVAEIIQANIDGVTENCDTVFLNFRISKTQDYNKQAWEEIIKATATLIAAAEMSNINMQDGSRIEEVNKILNKSYEFLINTTKLTGDENKIYGGYSIHLDIPKEYAQTIFPNPNK